METSKRGQWGSSFGFLMAAIGSAIGLGNLWAFPYKMGKTGGFAFLVLRRYAGERFACLFSALSFALYHTAMMLGWFSPPLFLLALAGLAAGGVLFDLLDAGSGTIFPSWAVHIFANLAINTVGFILFKIL